MDVSIVTPEQEVWSGAADMVIARSPEGEFGIMRGHVPFLAALAPGVVRVTSGGDRRSYVVSGPADRYHVIVLADDAEEVGDIDAAEARRRIEDAAKKAEEDRHDRKEAELAAALAGPQLGRG